MPPGDWEFISAWKVTLAVFGGRTRLKRGCDTFHLARSVLNCLPKFRVRRCLNNSLLMFGRCGCSLLPIETRSGSGAAMNRTLHPCGAFHFRLLINSTVLSSVRLLEASSRNITKAMNHRFAENSEFESMFVVTQSTWEKEFTRDRRGGY